MDTSGSQPQSAERIVKKAVEVFRQRVEEIVVPIETLNLIYEINGLNVIVDVDECDIRICNAYILDIHNPAHIEAIEIAAWLFKELYSFRNFLFLMNGDEIDEDIVFYPGADNDDRLKEITDDIRRSYEHPLYPYLPAAFKEKLRAVNYAFAVFAGKFYGWDKETQLKEMRSSPKHGFVYLIQSSTGSYKIGRTKNPDNRMRTFGVQLPFEVDYVCTIESADMYALERELHQRYASKRINGEWFMLSADDVASIANLAVQA